MNSKISVIIPVYNTERYLARCLESIINQSLREIEIIIVNDGSPDNSQQIIEQFAQRDGRIIVINQPNGGLSKARNTGLSIAQGEYILHIDSDDWVEDNYLSDMYSIAKAENLDIVVSDIWIDYDNGNIRYLKDLRFTHSAIINNRQYLQGFLCGKISPNAWNKLLKRSLYHANNITHPEGISLGEDLATIPKLAYYAKRIGKLNQAYVHYIQNPHSITKENNIQKLPQLLTAFSILEDFFKNKCSGYDFRALKIHHLSYYLMNGKYNANDSLYRGMIAKCLELHKGFIPKGIHKKWLPYFVLLKLMPTQSAFKVIHIFHSTTRKILRKLKTHILFFQRQTL